jgi:prophage regulatory protein
MFRDTQKESILRRHDVQRITGLSRSTIYAKVKQGDFPKPIKLGERSVGWLENEVHGWIEQKIKERNMGA